jgi:SPFH domain / Band 7 family
MAKQWERTVVLIFGKLRAVRSPGLFVIVPVMDVVTVWIDQRIQTIELNAEQALTRNTVPTNIDSILFSQMHDSERAALEITDYRQAILRVAQTSLREMIGSSNMNALVSDRKAADGQLREGIGRKTTRAQRWTGDQQRTRGVNRRSVLTRRSQVGVLMGRMVGLADVYDILLANVEPMNRKSEIGMRPFGKTKIDAEPISSRVWIMSQNQNMLEKAQTHERSPWFGDGFCV